jgi:peptidoglycan/LPS O-acetylase OafA/YrhL
MTIRVTNRLPAAADTKPDGRKLGYRPALAGIRALAIVLVLLRHAAPSLFPGGGIVGVLMFFVLSGFLITWLLLDERDSTGRIRLRRFYLRRMARLAPAMWVMLAGYVAITAALGEHPVRLWQSVMLALTYTYSLVNPDWATPDLGPMWSLSVEEQFYLLWPAVLILVLRRRLSHRRLALVSGLAALVDASVRAALWPTVGNALYTLPVTWADALFIGGAVAALVRGGRWLQLPRKRLAAPAGAAAVTGLLILCSACFVPDLKTAGWLYLAGLPVLSLAAGAVIVGALTLAPLERLLAWRPVVWTGDLSYSIYLWNFAFFVIVERHLGSSTGQLLVGRPVSIALTVLAAAGSYYLVERPTGRRARRLRWLR